MKIFRFIIPIVVGLIPTTLPAENLDLNISIRDPISSAGFITSYTTRNEGINAKPIGSFISGGQGFRRGDVPIGHCVKLTNDSGGDVVYQVDSIVTRTENNDDGSIRFLTWAAQTDSIIPAGGQYTVKFVLINTPCSSGDSGPALAEVTNHNLKLDLTDVRNQDGSVRLGGHLELDFKDLVNNTGRDAPRQYANGPVYSGWILSGAPKNDMGILDPALYAQCYVDIITSGTIRHSCLVHNSWMNVAEGSIGNSGAPGPAGLKNDPQAISYRPVLFDGQKKQLNWGEFWDRSVDSATNPINLISTKGGCGDAMPYKGKGDWTLPGLIPLQHGMALFYHTDGTVPSGMENDKIYFIYANGNEAGSQGSLDNVHLLKAQFGCPIVGSMDPTTQGGGIQSFSWRVWQAHNTAWLSVDQNATDNFTDIDGNRIPADIYPALTKSEQDYWKQTGLIPPVRETVGLADPIDIGGDIAQHIYSPLTKGNQHSGNSPGMHSNLAQINEYVSQAILGETKELWNHAVIGSASYYSLPWATLINERTGRIPALNNGRPGINHAGDGTPYAELGTPFGNIGDGVSNLRTIGAFIRGTTPALDNIPYDDQNNGYYRGGMLGTALIENSHFGSYHNGIYAIWGRRRDLEALYFTANRTHTQIYYEDGFGRQTNTINGVRYYSQLAYCCEGRGEQNAYRDRTLAAAFGKDGSDERIYFGHMLDEIYWYQKAVDEYIDGSSANFRSNFTDPWQHAIGADTFMDAYGAMMAYQGYAMLRDKLSLYMLNHYLQLYVSGCSKQDPTNVMSPFWCATYQYSPNLKDGGAVLNAGGKFAPDTGKYYANDSSERGLIPNGWVYTPGSGVICQARGSYSNIWLANGDKAKPLDIVYPGPDELKSDIWYVITNVQNTGPNGSTDCFELIDPNTNNPFPAFTLNGAPFQSTYSYLKTRPTIDRKGWASGYSLYAQPILYALKILGFSEIEPAVVEMSRRSVEDGYPGGFIESGSQNTRQNWDPNIRVH